MSYTAIQVEHLGKDYQIGARQEGYGTLRDALVRTATAAFRRKPQSEDDGTTLHALQDVSFSVPSGQVLGIIGRNGAGKSTLLKVLSRITEPTTGRIRVRGRVASLLEVGTGFHGELTGRENLYLNGSILGMSRREIQRNFDEIVAFAEVERFIDTPVKRYSSGMYLRLAFAIAAHLNPEILIIDEVLAVGDAAFQTKCLGKMEQVASTGRTVLFVSHNMATVRALCERCIWMQEGRLLQDGPTAEVLEHYLQAPNEQTGVFDLTQGANDPSKSLQRLTLLDESGQVVNSVAPGDPLIFRIDLKLAEALRHPRALIGINSPLGERLFTVSSGHQPAGLPSALGETAVCCRLNELPLRPGRYSLSVYFGSALRLTELVEYAGSFEVVEGDFFGVGRLPPVNHGPILMRSEWHQVEPATAVALHQN